MTQQLRALASLQRTCVLPTTQGNTQQPLAPVPVLPFEFHGHHKHVEHVCPFCMHREGGRGEIINAIGVWFFCFKTFRAILSYLVSWRLAWANPSV